MGGVRRLPSGSFQARVQVDGEPWAQTFASLDEAREWLLLLDARRIAGTLPSLVSVSTYVERWLAALPAEG